MRAVVTRVRSASVEIGGEVKGRIGKGFLVLLGVSTEDTQAEAKKIADKICGLRVFEDEAGKMNVNPKDAASRGPRGPRPPCRSTSSSSQSAARAASRSKRGSSARRCRSPP